jgi:hypothetical protein
VYKHYKAEVEDATAIRKGDEKIKEYRAREGALGLSVTTVLCPELGCGNPKAGVRATVEGDKGPERGVFVCCEKCHVATVLVEGQPGFDAARGILERQESGAGGSAGAPVGVKRGVASAGLPGREDTAKAPRV